MIDPVPCYCREHNFRCQSPDHWIALVVADLKDADDLTAHTLNKHFRHLFAECLVYDEVVMALDEIRESPRAVRSESAYIFSLLRKIDRAGGYREYNRAIVEKIDREAEAEFKRAFARGE